MSKFGVAWRYEDYPDEFMTYFSTNLPSGEYPEPPKNIKGYWQLQDILKKMKQE